MVTVISTFGGTETFLFPREFPSRRPKMTTIELNRVESFRGSIEKASIMGDIVYVVTLVIS